jgi:hypothetical protein
MSLLNIFLAVLAGLLALLGIVTLGFALNPRPFRPHPAPSQPGDPAPFRPGLPAPVERHFAGTIGETPQRIHSAVVWGRGRSCIRGVWIALRFKAWYRPGEAFYRRMELTFFRRPVLRGSERFLGGKGRFELGERVEEGAEIDQGELLALWAETVWMAPVFVHHPDVRWEAVDDQKARLVVPSGAGSDSLLAHFDPHTGRMTHLEGLRYSSSAEELELWRVDILSWKEAHGLQIPGEISVGWGAAGSPVSYWTVDGVAYNVHVEDQLAEEIR